MGPPRHVCDIDRRRNNHGNEGKKEIIVTSTARVARAIRDLKRARKGITLRGLSIRDMVEEGRRGARRGEGTGGRVAPRSMRTPVAPVGFPPVTSSSLRMVARKIGEFRGVEKVILFGSYARGNPTPDSDVDLLVIWNTRKPLIDCRIAISRLFLERTFPMDVVVRRPAQVREALDGADSFVSKVIASGKVLYEKRR